MVDAQNVRAGGQTHHQQLEAMEKQITQEQAKHNNRLARLRRIRQLAQEQGKNETVERIDKLLEKEQKRFDGKQKRFQQRKDKISQSAEKGRGSKTERAAEGQTRARKVKPARSARRATRQKQKTETQKTNP